MIKEDGADLEVIHKGVKGKVLGVALFPFFTLAIHFQEVLEVVHLSNLARDGQSLVVLGPCYIVVVDCLLNRVAGFCEQEKAAHNQTSSPFSSLAVNGNHWLLDEVLFDHLELVIRKLAHILF